MEDCRGYDNDHIDRKNLPCIIKCRIKQSISDTHGFTLVELVVVLVIIAVLAAAIGPAFLGYIEKARKNSALNDGKKVYKVFLEVLKYIKNTINQFFVYTKYNAKNATTNSREYGSSTY